MQTKLHVNLVEGLIDVEGDEKFVREIYNDFKNDLRAFGKQSLGAVLEKKQKPEKETSKRETKRKARRTKTTAKKTDDEGKSKAPAYRPSLVKDLNLSGLSEFYTQFAPKNNAEKILIFVKFLENERQISPCTADQIYTCYRTLKQTVPQHFRQVITNTSGREYGYLEYNSVDDLKVSIIGQNHFDQGLVRAGDE